MRLFGMEISKSKPAQTRDPGVTASQPATPERAIFKAVESGKKWSVLTFCKDPNGSQYFKVDNLQARDAWDAMGESVDNYLRGHGSGEWRIEFYDDRDKLQWTFKTLIGGGQKQYRPVVGNRGNGDGTSGGGGSGGAAAVYKDMFQMMMEDRKASVERESKNSDAQIEFWKAQAAAGHGGDGFLENPVMQQLFTTLVNNMFVQKENFFGNLKEAMEFSRTLSPQIAPEGEMSALIGSIAPLITALVSARGGGAAAAVMPGITNVLGTLTKEQLLELTNQPDKLRALINSLPGGAVAPASEALPAPGASTAQPKAPPELKPEQEPVTDTTPGPSVDQASQRQPDPHLALVDSMLEQFRADITAGSTPDSLARQLVGMITYARGLPRAHRVLHGLITTGPENLEVEFDRFCAAIPELARDPQRTMALKLALITVLMAEEDGEAAGDTPDAEIPIESQEAVESVETIPSEEQVIQQEADMAGEVTQDPLLEETVEHERPGPDDTAGIRGVGTERTSGDAPGPEQQKPEDGSQVVRETDNTSQAA